MNQIVITTPYEPLEEQYVCKFSQHDARVHFIFFVNDVVLNRHEALCNPVAHKMYALLLCFHVNKLLPSK